MTILTDRSRIEAYQHCPRHRYWEYEYKGRGIVAAGGMSTALMIGSLVHGGLKQMWMGGSYQLDSGTLPPLAPDATPYQHTRREELMALVEGILEAWRLVRLPVLLDQYQVLDVEREEEPYDIGAGVSIMVRTDAVLRRKDDGMLFVWNAKTTKVADSRWIEQWKYDQQTLSEVLPVEKRYGEKCGGVLIEGMLKGMELEYPKGSGEWYYNSPLVWAWHNESGKDHPLGEWSARYEWTDLDGQHRLGKGWRKVPVWRAYPGGTRAWIAYLLARDPSALREQFIVLDPILRADREEEVERWKRETRIKEADCYYSRPEDFYMHTGHGNCIRPSRCSYLPLCWEGADPEGELYTIRVPNHRTEVENEGI